RGRRLWTEGGITAAERTKGSGRVAAVWRIAPNSSGTKRPAGFGRSTWTLSVRVCGSSVLATRATRPVKTSPGYATNVMSTRSPMRTNRMNGSATSEDIQTVLRSAMDMSGVVVSVLNDTAARYSPGLTLISVTVPEIGA